MAVKLKTLLKILLAIAFMVILMVSFIFSDKHLSKKLTRMITKVDSMGITEQGRIENARQAKIDELNIPYEQRQSLKNKTVFIGATKIMVRLALGNPSEPVQFVEDNKEVWIYYFEDFNRPTYLIFEGDKLISAKTGSNADLLQIK